MYLRSNDLALVCDGRADARLEARRMRLKHAPRTLKRHDFVANNDGLDCAKRAVTHYDLGSGRNAVLLREILRPRRRVLAVPELVAIAAGENERMTRQVPADPGVHLAEVNVRTRERLLEHPERPA